MTVPQFIAPDVPCGKHPGCLSHKTKPCEGCGRVRGLYPLDLAQQLSWECLFTTEQCLKMLEHAKYDFDRARQAIGIVSAAGKDINFVIQVLDAYQQDFPPRHELCYRGRASMECLGCTNPKYCQEHG